MKGSNVLCFIAGAAIGGVTTWYFTKKKYEELNEKDAESFRRKYTELREEYEKKEDRATTRRSLKTSKREMMSW